MKYVCKNILPLIMPGISYYITFWFQKKSTIHCTTHSPNFCYYSGAQLVQSKVCLCWSNIFLLYHILSLYIDYCVLGAKQIICSTKNGETWPGISLTVLRKSWLHHNCIPESLGLNIIDIGSYYYCMMQHFLDLISSGPINGQCRMTFLLPSGHTC
jgi:hypothetical protein